MSAARPTNRRNAALAEKVERLRQEAIVDAAVDLFYLHGYHSTSMDMIASALGVNKPFLYKRYENKAGILADVFSRAETLALEMINVEVSSSDPPSVKLYRAVKRFAQHAFAEYRLIAVYYGEARNLDPDKTARVNALRLQWERALATILESGRASGDFNYRSVDVIVLLITGMVAFVHEWAERIDLAQRELVCDDFARAALGVVGCR